MKVLEAIKPREQKVVTAYCELDDWTFDPRYTDGKCPICGWPAPGTIFKAASPVERALTRIPWDLAAIVLLAVILVILAIIVVKSTFKTRVVTTVRVSPSAQTGAASPAPAGASVPSPSGP